MSNQQSDRTLYCQQFILKTQEDNPTPPNTRFNDFKIYTLTSYSLNAQFTSINKYLTDKNTKLIAMTEKKMSYLLFFWTSSIYLFEAMA